MDEGDRQRRPDPIRRPFAEWVESLCERAGVWWDYHPYFGRALFLACTFCFIWFKREPLLGFGLPLATVLAVVIYERLKAEAERRRAARAAVHRCPVCNYDLRATPERCPECGAAATPPPGWTSVDVPQDSPWLDPAAAKLTPKPPRRTSRFSGRRG